MAEEIAQLKQIVNELSNDNLEMKKQIELLRDEVSRLSEELVGNPVNTDNDEIIDDDNDEIIDDDEIIDNDDNDEIIEDCDENGSGRILPDDNNDEIIDDSVDEEADCETNAKWIPLKNHNDYVIMNYYPYNIKKVSNGRIIKNTINKVSGYVIVALNGKLYRKHVLVAKQFIRNDDKENKNQVDHINHNKKDYHTSNLRWVSPSENNKNKSSFKGCMYEYIDTLPDDAFEIKYYETKYERREIKDYYYSAVEDKYYYDTGINYRILVVHENKSGTKFANVRDIHNKSIALCIARFKLQQSIY